MSPEQALGQKVDARTDIFSLGVMTYEMITGRAPFEGPTMSHVVVAILEQETSPLAQYAPEAPAELERIVSRALAKDRAQRYQTAKDLLGELTALKLDLEVKARLGHLTLPGQPGEAGLPVGGPANSAPDPYQTAFIDPAKSEAPGAETVPLTAGVNAVTAARATSSAEGLAQGIKRHKRGAVLLLALLAAVAAAIAFGLYHFLAQPRPGPVTPLQAMKLTRLTNSGKATQAVISPDGRYVVHAVDDAGQQSLWIRQVATTSHVQIVPPAQVEYRGLTFSRDGDHVYYVVAEKETLLGVLYRVAVLGGAS
jgi:hypothetical protein